MLADVSIVTGNSRLALRASIETFGWTVLVKHDEAEFVQPGLRV